MALATRLACVSMTPFGTPVVPEVYMRRAVASASRSSSPPLRAAFVGAGAAAGASEGGRGRRSASSAAAADGDRTASSSAFASASAATTSTLIGAAAGSSARTAATTAPARTAHSGEATTRRASAWPTTWRICSSLESRLTGLTRRPVCIAPSSRRIVPRPLPIIVETVSPRPTPSASRARPISAQSCARPAKVIVWAPSAATA